LWGKKVLKKVKKGLAKIHRERRKDGMDGCGTITFSRDRKINETVEKAERQRVTKHPWVGGGWALPNKDWNAGNNRYANVEGGVRATTQEKKVKATATIIGSPLEGKS